MINKRPALEAEFLRICYQRGPAWVESVIRPLRLPGAVVTPRDIPFTALSAIIRLFGRVRSPATGVAVI